MHFFFTDLSSSDCSLACICGVLTLNLLPPLALFSFSLFLTLNPPKDSAAMGVVLPEVTGVEDALVEALEEALLLSDGESDLTYSFFKLRAAAAALLACSVCRSFLDDCLETLLDWTAEEEESGQSVSTSVSSASVLKLRREESSFESIVRTCLDASSGSWRGLFRPEMPA